MRPRAGAALGLAVCLWMLVGCASRAPASIRDAPAEPLQVTQVQRDPDRYRDSLVRWGGHIVGVENRSGATWVRVLSRSLDRDGYPDARSAAGARFLARMPGFLDPAEYANERLITVVGRVAGMVELPVGDYPYPYVQVDARAHHLWPVPDPRPCCPAYPWYDPWYSPWYHPWWYRPYW